MNGASSKRSNSATSAFYVVQELNAFEWGGGDAAETSNALTRDQMRRRRRNYLRARRNVQTASVS
jgi:hypothetical protein